MLIVFQIPLADLRAFRSPGLRKVAPHWPTPDPGQEFVRYFGIVRTRDKRRGKLPWSDEGTFANASRAVLFPAFTEKRKKWTVAFRRLFCDGGAVVRFEVGIHIPSASVVSDELILNTVALLLDTPCMIRNKTGTFKLGQISKAVTELYGKATQRRKAPRREKEVIAGRPTVLVQFDGMDRTLMPKWLDFDSDHLAFMNTTHQGVQMNVWFTEDGFGQPRETRMALLRLSAEHQVLKYVLRDMAAGNMDAGENNPLRDKLQAYLKSAGETLSKTSRFGIDQTDLIRLTQSYGDLCGADELPLILAELEKLRPQSTGSVISVVKESQVQVPVAEPAMQGPAFHYLGAFEETEYQAFFNRKPQELLAVAWTLAVFQDLCPAVCRITLPKRGRVATGFLVGKDLVLTNYHVMKMAPAENAAANLADMEFVFTLSSQDQRVFRLVQGEAAAVKASDDNRLDYVLLRIEEDVVAALNVKPFHCNRSFQPVKDGPVYLIQHPAGGQMQFASERNGVTGIYPDTLRVQYISKAQGGSSGAPCIDDEKRLIALHHAEVQKPWGSVRQGVLMSAIIDEIQPFL